MARIDETKPKLDNADLFYRELLKARRLALRSRFGINRDRTQKPVDLDQASMMHQPAFVRANRNPGVHE